MLFKELLDKYCSDGVEYNTLQNETILNGYKQIGANELANLNTGAGNIKLLPSSKNYDWWCEESDDIKDLICEGNVITTGRARYSNIKYHEGKFIASQSHIIRSKDEKRLLPKYLFYFLSSCIQDFYVTDSSYPLFTKSVYYAHEIPIPPIEVQQFIIEYMDDLSSKKDQFIETLNRMIELNQIRCKYYCEKMLFFENQPYCETTIKDLIANKVIKTVTPAFKLKKSDYSGHGSVAIVSQEQELVSGYCDMTDDNIPYDEYVCFGDHTECVKYVPFRFVQGADGLKIMKSDDNVILNRFLYYALIANYIKKNTYERHYKYLLNTKIKYPESISTQNEIVIKLDKLTRDIEELNMYYKKSIYLMKQKYMYYIHQLFDLKRKV